jgi:hypothetical protein
MGFTCWFPSCGLGTQGVKLLLHVSFTRLAGKLELPDGVPKLELGNQPSSASGPMMTGRVK